MKRPQTLVTIVLLAGLLGPALGTARAAATMAGTVLVEKGTMVIQRGNPPVQRRVDDFARLELGDVLKTASETWGTFSSFDSGGIALEPATTYRVAADGIHKDMEQGEIRVYQFAAPLGHGVNPADLTALLGSVGKVEPQGEVWLRRAGKKDFKEIVEDTEVYYHDSLRTGPAGRAVLELENKASLVVEEDSIAQLQKDAVVLEKGGVLTHWRRHGTRFAIQTPMSIVGVRGTIFRVETEESGGDRVGVYEGQVQVVARAAKEARAVDPGMLARVSRDGHLGGVETIADPQQARDMAQSLTKALAKIPARADRAEYLDRVMQTARRMADTKDPLPRNLAARPKAAEPRAAAEPVLIPRRPPEAALQAPVPAAVQGADAKVFPLPSGPLPPDPDRGAPAPLPAGKPDGRIGKLPAAAPGIDTDELFRNHPELQEEPVPGTGAEVLGDPTGRPCQAIQQGTPPPGWGKAALATPPSGDEVRRAVRSGNVPAAPGWQVQVKSSDDAQFAAAAEAAPEAPAPAAPEPLPAAGARAAVDPPTDRALGGAVGVADVAGPETETKPRTQPKRPERRRTGWGSDWANDWRKPPTPVHPRTPAAPAPSRSKPAAPRAATP